MTTAYDTQISMEFIDSWSPFVDSFQLIVCAFGNFVSSVS